MHEPYDEDDGYDDEHYNYDYSDKFDPYKFYFKFEIDSNSSLSEWLNNLFKDIGTHNILNFPDFPVVSFPVNSYIPNTENDIKNSFLYLGNNYHNQPIWKQKYFIKDTINTAYKNHIAANAEHFIKQPSYYKGLFDILN